MLKNWQLQLPVFYHFLENCCIIFQKIIFQINTYLPYFKLHSFSVGIILFFQYILQILLQCVVAPCETVLVWNWSFVRWSQQLVVRPVPGIRRLYPRSYLTSYIIFTLFTSLLFWSIIYCRLILSSVPALICCAWSLEWPSHSHSQTHTAHTEAPVRDVHVVFVCYCLYTTGALFLKWLYEPFCSSVI